MKKTHHLEEYIRQNKAEFDIHEPDPSNWEAIAKRLDDQQPKVWVQWLKNPYRLAASILLLLGLGYATAIYTGAGQQTDTMIARVSPEEGREAFRYASMIETRREELNDMKTQHPELYQQFAGEIEALDKEYQSLRQEFSKTPNQEELVKAMIFNLQTQLEILNHQLDIIQKIRKAKTNENVQI